MKKNLTFLFLLFFFASCNLPEKKNASKVYLKPARVDHRVELLSIVSRLADYGEYSQQKYKKYVNDIHAYFDAYKDHPAVLFAKKLRKESGIGFSDVMALAVHLEKTPQLKAMMPLSEANLPDDWKEEEAEQYISLLQQFYTDTHMEEFLDNQEKRYELAEERFMQVYEQVELDWYEKYYGNLPENRFTLLIGLGNGGANYGPDIIYPDSSQEVFAVMGTWSVDSLGEATYTVEQYLPTIIHEFNHSFINHLVDQYEEELQPVGQVLFKESEEAMKRQAYASWKTMMYEYLVRASVVRYLKKYHPEKVEEEIRRLHSRGFLYMEKLVGFLDTYENNRDIYPTLESFMPQLIGFYNTQVNLAQL